MYHLLHFLSLLLLLGRRAVCAVLYVCACLQECVRTKSCIMFFVPGFRSRAVGSRCFSVGKEPLLLFLRLGTQRGERAVLVEERFRFSYKNDGRTIEKIQC